MRSKISHPLGPSLLFGMVDVDQRGLFLAPSGPARGEQLAGPTPARCARMGQQGLLIADFPVRVEPVTGRVMAALAAGQFRARAPLPRW